MLMSVSGSTVTAAMKISASASVGSAGPTLSVPGINSSGTRRKSLKIAVVGANPPIPRVSKKSVAKPSATSAPRALRAPGALRRRSIANHVQAYQPPMSTSATSRTRVLVITVLTLRAVSCDNQR
jgi:hypothetical protein